MGSLTIRTPRVRARKLTFRYPSGRWGVRDLDLSVEAGEVVVVLGPNGSGKSSLLRLLATEREPSGGTLVLLGHSDARRPRGLRRKIGYAPDLPVHFDSLTGHQNARLFGELAGMARTTWVERLPVLFEAFDLHDVKHLSVSDYSFGMRRKLLLVQACLHHPQLLLLDEPTVGLDVSGRDALRGEVQALSRAGAAVIMASNELTDLPTWADRVVFLHRGRLVEDAAPANLLQRVADRIRIRIAWSGGSLGHRPNLEVARTSGIEEITWTSDGLAAWSRHGIKPLPALIEGLIDEGLMIRDVRVREPDLGDWFRLRTGETLVSLDRKDQGMAGDPDA